MKIDIKWVSLLAVALVGVTFLYVWQSETVGPAQAKYETARVSRETLSRKVISTGVIRPVVGAEINVGSQVSGIVQSLPVRVGDAVAAGDLLAELDPTPFEALVSQAKAEVALARAELSLAESNFERKQGLSAQGYSAEADLQTAKRDLDVGRAQLELSEARLRSNEIDLGYTRITAPIRGVIADVTTREGETVAANFAAPTFVTIVDLGRLEVQAYVDETDIGRVFMGQTATFTVDTYPDAEFDATVITINPKAELQGSVVNYVVILAFEEQQDRILRPEMTAHVRLKLEERKDVIATRRSALKRKNGRQVVMVERNGTWKEQVVKVGWRTDDWIEILDGLAEGERVQINPN
jgi:RND family efflux transporter MFP subunit